MNFPEELQYTASHEWVRREADGTLSVGITDHAQESLGELVFVEMPAAGRRLAAGDACAVVESVKAASDVYAPVAGAVIARNDALAETPNAVNKDPYAAWLFRIKPDAGGLPENLMDAASYRKGLEPA